MNSLNKEFNHAGFSFPKYLWTLPKGSLKDRLVKARKPQVCGPYYTSPKPLGDGTHPGQGFTSMTLAALAVGSGLTKYLAPSATKVGTAMTSAAKLSAV